MKERIEINMLIYKGYLREVFVGTEVGKRVRILKIQKVESFWKLAVYLYNAILNDNEENDLFKVYK